MDNALKIAVKTATAGECKIRIGDICLTVSSDYPGFSENFRHYYRCIADSTAPDLRARVHIREKVRREDISGSLDTYRGKHPFLQNKFSLHDDLISGDLDLKTGTCEVWVELAVIASDYLPLFQDLLFRDLPHRVRQTKCRGNGNRQFIVHGCGVVRNGKGILFLGPSGCGKSTLARLSSGSGVQHDEAILLSENKNEFRIETTPYASGIPDLQSLSAPLKAAFFLNHGNTNEIFDVSRSESAGRLMQLVSPPLPEDAEDQMRLTGDILSFSCRAVEAIPFSVLQFSNRDESFWGEVDGRIG